MTADRDRDFGEAIIAPATSDALLRYVSVSAIGSFDHDQDGGCQRRWFFRKVLKKPEPETKATEIGKTCHAQAEHYEETAEDVLGPIMRAGKHFIPTRLDGEGAFLIEHDFCHEKILKARDASDAVIRAVAPLLTDGNATAAIRKADNNLVDAEIDFENTVEAFSGFAFDLVDRARGIKRGVPLVGFIDLIHQYGWHYTSSGARVTDPKDTIETFDHKTTSSLSMWAKRGEDLIHTIQMPMYAHVGRIVLPVAGEFARLSHGYYGTKKREAEKRTALVPYTKIDQRVTEIKSIVRSMGDVAKESDASKVDLNLKACGSYGGCPHRAYCPRSKEQVLFTLFKGRTMSLKDKVNAMKSEGAPSTQTAPATQPKAADNPHSEESVREELERLRAEEAARKQGAKAPESKPADPYGVCEACGVKLSADNASHSPITKRTKHIGCSKAAQPSTVAPDVPRSGVGAESAAALPPENRAGLSPVVRAAVDKAQAPASTPQTTIANPGASQAPSASSASSATSGAKPGSKCKASGSNVEVTAADVLEKIFSCVACGVGGLKCKGSKVGGIYVAKVPAHATPGAPASAPAPASRRAPAPEPSRPFVSDPDIIGDEIATQQETREKVEQRNNDAEIENSRNIDMPPRAVVAEMLAHNDKRCAMSILFVGCGVEANGVIVRDFDTDYIRPICKALEEEYTCGDIRFAPKDSPLGFGGWKGALAALVRTEAPSLGLWRMGPAIESEIRAVVLEASADHFDLIVRGR